MGLIYLATVELATKSGQLLPFSRRRGRERVGGLRCRTRPRSNRSSCNRRGRPGRRRRRCGRRGWRGPGWRGGRGKPRRTSCCWRYIFVGKGGFGGRGWDMSVKNVSECGLSSHNTSLFEGFRRPFFIDAWEVLPPPISRFLPSPPSYLSCTNEVDYISVYPSLRSSR